MPREGKRTKAARAARAVRRLVAEGDCGRALYMIRAAAQHRILSSRLEAALRAKVDRCYVRVRGGYV